jgi:hypothetical protein
MAPTYKEGIVEDLMSLFVKIFVKIVEKNLVKAY